MKNRIGVRYWISYSRYWVTWATDVWH